MRSSTHYISSRRTRKWPKFERVFQSTSNRFVRWRCQNKCDQKQCEYLDAKCIDHDFEKKTHVLSRHAISNHVVDFVKITLSDIWNMTLLLNRSLSFILLFKNLNRVDQAIRHRRRRHVQKLMSENDFSSLSRSFQSSVIFMICSMQSRYFHSLRWDNFECESVQLMRHIYSTVWSHCRCENRENQCKKQIFQISTIISVTNAKRMQQC